MSTEEPQKCTKRTVQRERKRIFLVDKMINVSDSPYEYWRFTKVYKMNLTADKEQNLFSWQDDKLLKFPIGVSAISQKLPSEPFKCQGTESFLWKNDKLLSFK